MVRVLVIIIIGIFLQSCTEKETVPGSLNNNGFPSTTNALPAALKGKWVRMSRLQTFDFKPDE